jgi:hypothetical protein
LKLEFTAMEEAVLYGRILHMLWPVYQ